MRIFSDFKAAVGKMIEANNWIEATRERNLFRAGNLSTIQE
jgi:hypothetical protein